MTDSIPTKEITIAGKEFLVKQPYAAGHIVTEAEAKALNQVLAENIRNNCAAKVKAAYDGTAKEGEPTASTIVAYVTEYSNAYQFTLASVGGGKRVTDPVELEALSIARATFADHCKKKGYTVKDVRAKLGEDAYNERIAKLAEREEVVKEARRRVKQRQNVAETQLDELDLGDMGKAPAGEPETEPTH